MPKTQTTLGLSLLVAVLWAGPSINGAEASRPTLTVDPGHAWTPPFGVERVGRPLEAVVEVPGGAEPGDEFAVAAYRDGREISRQAVTLVDEKTNYFSDQQKGRFRFGRLVLENWPAEVALWAKPKAASAWTEVARVEVKPPAFEADAEARSDKPVNPVDLGAIFPPASWLLLQGGQGAEVEIAALSRAADIPGATVSAWYESSAESKVSTKLSLAKDTKVCATLALGASSRSRAEDTLHVAIADGAGVELWRKDIHAMLVAEPPRWPRFGAVETLLRYDGGIPVPGGKTIDYKQGWDPKLKDVVVVLPGGGRFVFWRGSCNIPFWAGRDNTGFCYEWAERAIPFVWSEALLDHEARYSRVEILESTESRVHVRWHYRAVDEKGQASTGDFFREDFYFYPDGFGTRVLTLTCIPGASYELNEFIPITPAGGYPLRMLPPNMLDFLWISGEKASFRFPFLAGDQPDEVAKAEAKAKGRLIPMPKFGSLSLSVPDTAPPIYRIRIGERDPLAVIQFNPGGWGPTWPGGFIPGMFGPQYDRGATVTRAYWGYHWPLSRVGGLGASGKDGIDRSPAHNSIATTGWTAGENEPSPRPIHRERQWMRDANGEYTQMRRDTFAWLIGMTDCSDDQLRQRAQSYREPPPVKVQGAVLDADSYYSLERRAVCLAMSEGSHSVGIAVSPKVPLVDPVFEIERTPKALKEFFADGARLDCRQYAWDGRILWLDLTISQPTELRLEFAATAN